ncbi:uncharacterized protein PV06_07139 [Exophiala oligosperma]|uniref:FAD-binding PCMH-type domain-containing protein n=1 Tax=Exophiala oligosperma TaxID=215243 RepID=A0A0D2ANT5_9EURO|nr:uncharacterized protein PV06_07139 [Exophiala oligosperma]KIW41596.1 hypothetical protein PV06_07139 [Exophiala oligosperma]
MEPRLGTAVPPPPPPAVSGLAPGATSQVYHRDTSTPEYEQYRTRYITSNVPSRFPLEIHLPSNTKDVVAAVRRARILGVRVGVRSGGHSFPCSSLVEDGLLIDMRNVHRRVLYNPHSGHVEFGPGVKVKEVMDELNRLGRFFPTGHAPSVGMGGFTLNGGQGWFMRGWGITSEQWIVKMEIVTANGDVVVASKEENSDLFWAARGSGQWFPGIVTRIWGRTVPRKRLWHRTLTFRVGEAYEELMRFVFEREKRSPKWGVEVALCTFFPGRYQGREGDEIGDDTLLFAVEMIAFCDGLKDAETLLSAWSDVPQSLTPNLVQDDPVRATNWDELFAFQDSLVPYGHGERWLCDSILSQPDVEDEELIKRIKTAMCDLPTRLSVGCVYISQATPDERDQCCSLPQKYYVASFVGWTEVGEEKERTLRSWLSSAFSEAEVVSCGMYIADFDHQQRQSRVMTPYAEQRFAEVFWEPSVE